MGSSSESSFVQEQNSTSINRSVGLTRAYLLGSQSPAPGEPRDEEIELIKAFKPKTNKQLAAEEAAIRAKRDKDGRKGTVSNLIGDGAHTQQSLTERIKDGQEEGEDRNTALQVQEEKGDDLQSHQTAGQPNKEQKGTTSKPKKNGRQNKANLPTTSVQRLTRRSTEIKNLSQVPLHD